MLDSIAEQVYIFWKMLSDLRVRSSYTFYQRVCAQGFKPMTLSLLASCSTSQAKINDNSKLSAIIVDNNANLYSDNL